MNCKMVLQCASLLFLFALQPSAWADTEIIEQLTASLAKAKSGEEKSRLYMYRARNYCNEGMLDKAEKDYDLALRYNHKGWIHLERAKFYLKLGEHDQARKEASAAEKETPTLAAQAERILVLAKKVQKENLETSEPKEILLTRRWNVSYTRTSPPTYAKNVRESYAARSKAKAKRKSVKRGKS